jgi:YrbI family 3-deoxy-D-manno-octulosonate 8-phosphate phosphatase
MHILAIIPARGGSKGIPRKNVRLVGGIPLVAHSIRHAREASCVTRVVVSTDDAEIAAVSQEFGAEVVMRPATIAGDTASSESALLHVLETLAEGGYMPDLVVFLQATSPVRDPGDIDRAVATLLAEDADSLFSACRVEGFVWRNEKGAISSFSYDYRNRARRQDAPEDLIENGSIYVFRPTLLRETGNRLGGRIAVLRQHPLDSFQVDEPQDLEVVERILSFRQPPLAAPSDLALLVLDFDGVLTDNAVWVDETGREAVRCSRSDGFGIGLARAAGIEVLILSKEQNPVVAARSRKLRIECVQGCDDKLSRLRQLVATRGLSPAQVGYVGNDVNDLECLRWVGFPVAVADAEPAVKSASRRITTRPGGHGAVREVIEWLLAARAAQPVVQDPGQDPGQDSGQHSGQDSGQDLTQDSSQDPQVVARQHPSGAR